MCNINKKEIKSDLVTESKKRDEFTYQSLVWEIIHPEPLNIAYNIAIRSSNLMKLPVLWT